MRKFIQMIRRWITDVDPLERIASEPLTIALMAAFRYDGHAMRPMPVALAAVFIAALPGAALRPLFAQEAASVNRVIEQLRQGRPAIGTFTRTARPDLDFAVIDEQYGDFDIDGVREAVVAVGAGDDAPTVTPVVRIPLAARDAPEAVVKQVLDPGALSVIFPDIETKEQAMTAISSMRFAQAEDDYRARADVWPLDPSGKLVAMLQIESLAGIEHLGEILDVPGIGVIFLGPTDLATSAGEEGPNAPRVEALVQEVLVVLFPPKVDPERVA